MLFSGKTMASPQNSVSCQVFVKRQYQNAAFFSFPGLFPCLMLGQAWRVQGCHPEIRGILTIAGFRWRPSWEHVTRSSYFLDASQKLPIYLISYNYTSMGPQQNVQQKTACSPPWFSPPHVSGVPEKFPSVLFQSDSLCAFHIMPEITFENSKLTLIFILLFQPLLWCSSSHELCWKCLTLEATWFYRHFKCIHVRLSHCSLKTFVFLDVILWRIMATHAWYCSVNVSKHLFHCLMLFSQNLGIYCVVILNH